MIEVELPDGSIAEFPDGTPPDVMKQALQRRFGAPRQEAPPSPQFQRGLQELGAISQDPLGSMARQQYEALPGWQKPIVAAGDTLQLVANGATFGFGDKAVAAARAPFTGKSYQDELAQQRGLTQGARNRAGGAGVAAEIAGGVRVPLSLANKGLSLAGRLGTGAMTGVPGLAARTGLMAAEGAGYGALTAAGNDQDLATGAGVGALAGGLGNVAGEAISGAVSKVAGKFNPKVPTASVTDLKAASNAAYQRAENAGVAFNNNGVNKLRSDIVNDLTSRGFDPVNEPGVMPVIKRLEALGNGNITLKGLDTLRKVAANGYRPGMKSNNAAIGGIINRIDELVNAADPNMILMGQNPQQAATALREARSLWGRARKLETVETLINKGELIGGSQVNQNVAGATQRQLRTILTNEGKARGFNQAELAATKKAVMGTPAQRAMHAVGGLLPRDRLTSSVHAVGALSTGGASAPLQAAGMAAGWGAQKVAERLANKSVLELTQLIANGGIPPAQVQNVVQRLAHTKREALSRALMALGVNLWVGQQPAHQ